MMGRRSSGDREAQRIVSERAGLTEEERREYMKWGFYSYALLISFSLMIFTVIFYLFCFAWNWQPYTFKSLETVPSRVCVGQQVTLTINRDIKPSNFDNPEAYRYESFWIDTETDKRIVTNIGTLSITDASTATNRMTSTDYRSVPDVPKTYIFGQDVSLHGAMGPVDDKEQFVSMLSQRETEVLPADHPDCPRIAENTRNVVGEADRT